MKTEITIREAKVSDIEGILTLQKANLVQQITAETAEREGFVTVQHDFELLKKMNNLMAHTVAEYKGRIVGFALAMHPSFRSDVPVLIPMFEMIEGLVEHQSGPSNYMVMGQICIDKDFRGQGIFSSMYDNLRHRFAGKFNSIITEIATRNTRSIRAHNKVGFELLKRFTDATDQWDLVEWRW